MENTYGLRKGLIQALEMSDKHKDDISSARQRIEESFKSLQEELPLGYSKDEDGQLRYLDTPVNCNPFFTPRTSLYKTNILGQRIDLPLEGELNPAHLGDLYPSERTVKLKPEYEFKPQVHAPYVRYIKVGGYHRHQKPVLMGSDPEVKSVYVDPSDKHLQPASPMKLPFFSKETGFCYLDKYFATHPFNSNVKKDG